MSKIRHKGFRRHRAVPTEVIERFLHYSSSDHQDWLRTKLDLERRLESANRMIVSSMDEVEEYTTELELRKERNDWDD